MLHHVSIETPLSVIDASVGFYALLGFAEVEVPAGLRRRARWMERDGTQVHLLFSEDPVIPPQGHLALVVAGYDAVLAALRAAGHEPSPRAEHWGAPRAYVRDPAGHLVELMAAPPPPGRDAPAPRR